MKKGLIVAFVLVLSILVMGSQVPATAAIVKTTVSVTAPSYVYAGVSNPVDVSICPKSSATATVCEITGERTVILYENNKKVLTAKTTGGGGIAQFRWVPLSSGKVKLKAVIKAAGSLRTLSSESKTIFVKQRVAFTSIGTWSCGSKCVYGIPEVINLSQEQTITASLISGVSKARKIRFQILRTNNTYRDVLSGLTSWQDDLGQYGYTVNVADVYAPGDCAPGESLTWNFRFYVDATSKSPGSATNGKWITLKCPGAPNGGDVSIDVTFQDQVVDYTSNNPEDMLVAVTAPSSTQYSLGSEYCSRALDCENSDNWYSIQYFSQEDNLLGNGTFSLSTDPGDYGQYYVRAVVINWTSLDMFYSEKYTLDLN